MVDEVHLKKELFKRQRKRTVLMGWQFFSVVDNRGACYLS